MGDQATPLFWERASKKIKTNVGTPELPHFYILRRAQKKKKGGIKFFQSHPPTFEPKNGYTGMREAIREIVASDVTGVLTKICYGFWGREGVSTQNQCED